MKPVIIGNGYIGSGFADFFNKNNIDHKVISRSEIDYTTKKGIKHAVSHGDIIINCAGVTGETSIDDCEQIYDEAMRVNGLLPSLLLKEASTQNNKPFIHISTGCVFSGDEKTPFKETDDPNLLYGAYRKSKLEGEKKLIETDKNFWIFRIRMPFDDRKVSRNWVVKLIKYDKILSGINSVTHVDSFCEDVWEIVNNHPANGIIVNAVEKEPVRTEDVAKLLVTHGLKKPFSLWDDSFTNHHIPRSNCVLDTHLYEKLLKNKSKKPVKELILNAIKSIK
jgi:dTDP-4-dehydrorhamnose reductase